MGEWGGENFLRLGCVNNSIVLFREEILSRSLSIRTFAHTFADAFAHATARAHLRTPLRACGLRIYRDLYSSTLISALPKKQNMVYIISAAGRVNSHRSEILL